MKPCQESLRARGCASGAAPRAQQAGPRGSTNALTIDVEDYFHVAALAPAIPRESWQDRRSRVEGNTDRRLEILRQRRVRGSFFVLGWVAERFPALVRRIAAAGHEVACHGFSHELIYRQTRSTFQEETHRAKALLEDAIA